MITEISENETLLTVERLSRLDPARRAALLQRGAGRLRSLREPVSAILRDVRERGDAALLEYAERFDGARPVALRVSKEELARALQAADPDYLAALRQATEAITTFHRRSASMSQPLRQRRACASGASGGPSSAWACMCRAVGRCIPRAC